MALNACELFYADEELVDPKEYSSDTILLVVILFSISFSFED